MLLSPLIDALLDLTYLYSGERIWDEDYTQYKDVDPEFYIGSKRVTPPPLTFLCTLNSKHIDGSDSPESLPRQSLVTIGWGVQCHTTSILKIETKDITIYHIHLLR